MTRKKGIEMTAVMTTEPEDTIETGTAGTIGTTSLEILETREIVMTVV